MKNRMTFRVLCYLTSGNANRDFSGYPKTHTIYKGKKYPRMSSQCVKSAITGGPTSSVGCKLYRDDSECLAFAKRNTKKTKKDTEESYNNKVNKKCEDTNITTYSEDGKTKDERQFLYGKMYAGEPEKSWNGALTCTDFLALNGQISMEDFTLNLNNKKGSEFIGTRFLYYNTMFYGECSIELALWKELCKSEETFENRVRPIIKEIIKSIINFKPYSLSSRTGFAVQFVLCSPTNESFTIQDEIIQKFCGKEVVKENVCKYIIESQKEHSEYSYVTWGKSHLEDVNFTGLKPKILDEFVDKCLEETFKKEEG